MGITHPKAARLEREVWQHSKDILFIQGQFCLPGGPGQYLESVLVIANGEGKVILQKAVDIVTASSYALQDSAWDRPAQMRIWLRRAIVKEHTQSEQLSEGLNQES